MKRFLQAQIGSLKEIIWYGEMCSKLGELHRVPIGKVASEIRNLGSKFGFDTCQVVASDTLIFLCLDVLTYL